MDKKNKKKKGINKEINKMIFLEFFSMVLAGAVIFAMASVDGILAVFTVVMVGIGCALLFIAADKAYERQNTLRQIRRRLRKEYYSNLR